MRRPGINMTMNFSGGEVGPTIRDGHTYWITPDASHLSMSNAGGGYIQTWSGDAVVDWGDGTTTTVAAPTSQTVTVGGHEWSEAGTYEVNFSGNLRKHGGGYSTIGNQPLFVISSNYYIPVVKATFGYNAQPVQLTCFNMYQSSTLTSLEFTDDCNVIDIGRSFCSNCRNLTEVHFPPDLTGIGSTAFESCNKLSVFDMDKCRDKLALLGSQFGTGLPFRAFSVPPNVTGFNDSFRKADFYFVGFENETLTSLYDRIFSYSAIWHVDLPEQLKVINTGAFADNVSLYSQSIPNEVTSIGSGAFSGCKNLKFITIPASVTSIAATAFNNCTSLRYINCLATTPPTADSTTFTNVPTGIPVFVPTGTSAAYAAATGWSGFTDFEEIAEDQVVFIASDGAVCKYTTAELSVGAPANYLQFRTTVSPYPVNLPFSQNEHLSMDVQSGTVISTLAAINDPYGNMLSGARCMCNNIGSLSTVNLPNLRYIGPNGFSMSNTVDVMHIPNVVSVDNAGLYGSHFKYMCLPKVEYMSSKVVGWNQYIQFVYLADQDTPPVIEATTFEPTTNTQLEKIWVKHGTYDLYAAAPYWSDLCLSGYVQEFF